MRTVSLGGNGTLKGGGGAIDTTGTVEARVALQGFVLRPMPSASGGDGRSTGCCLTVLNDVDAGGLGAARGAGRGWVPGCGAGRVGRRGGAPR